MASNNDDFDFDLDDFDLDIEQGKKEGSFISKALGSNRKAVTDFTGGFLSGLKNQITKPENQRRVINKVLPKGFTVAFDAYSNVKRDSKQLYADAKDEFIKELGDIDQDMKSVLGAYGKYGPKALVDRLERAAESTARRTYAEPSAEQELDEELDGMMGLLLKTQRQQSLLSKKNTVESTQKIVEGQAATTTAIMGATRVLQNVSRNTDILVGIGTAQAKMQRKAVELTFNQLMVSRKTLDVLEQTRSLQESAFKSLIKNTGLPDHVKATLWEETSRSFKNRLIGNATDRITAGFGETYSQAMAMMNKHFREKAGGAGRAISDLLSAGGMAAEMGDMMGSKSQQAGGVAANIVGWILREQLIKKVGNKLNDNPRIKVYGNNIENLVTSAPGMFNKLQDNMGFFNQLAGMIGLGDLRVGDYAERVKVRGNTIRDLDAHQAYNRKSDLALTEVIPGWLGKMYNTLNRMATGNANTSNIEFDWERGVFAKSSDLDIRLKDQMFNKHQVRYSREELIKVVNQLDSKRELSGSDRRLLMEYVMKQANSNVGYIDPSALMDASNSPIPDGKAAARIAEVLSGVNNFNSAGTDALQELRNMRDGKTGRGMFSNNNKNAQYQEKMLAANNALKSLRTMLPNGMSAMVEQANVGNMERLQRTGIVKWNNSTKQWDIDHDKYLKAVMDGKIPEGPPPPDAMGGPVSGFPTPNRPSGGGSSFHARAGSSAAFGSSTNSMLSDPVGVDGYTNFQRDLLSAIEHNSAKTAVDVSNQILEAIRTRLDLGIPTGGPAEPMQEVNRKASIFRRLIGAVSRSGNGKRSFLSNIARANLKIAAIPFQMFTGSIQAGATITRNLFRTVMGKATTVVSSTSKAFGQAMGDVYVNGRDDVAMKAKDIKAGQYFDKLSGRVITSLKDIKGAIVDAAGNEVISTEDIKQGLFTLVNGTRKGILGNLISGVGRAAGGIMNLNLLPLKIARGGLNAVMSIAKLALAPLDLYVDGEESPRLLARIMSSGGYFNTDGSVIRKLSDIKGDVLDRTGNVILSVSDISKGLMDKYGRPMKSLGEKILSIATKPFRMIGSVYRGTKSVFKGAAKLAIAGAKAPFKGIGAFANMFKSSNRPELQISAHTADTVDAIYNLLNERIPRPKQQHWNDTDGSGFRDGSYEDLKNRKKGEVKDKGDPNKPAEKKKGGILGMLMAMVGGIGGLIGTVRSWFGNIFGLMRLTAQTKMATSAMDMIGSIAGRGRRGRTARVGKMASLAKLGKIAAIGGIGAAALFAAQSAYAGEMFKGATDALSKTDMAAFAANNLGLNDVGGSSSSGGGSGGEEKLSLMDRIKNGVGGSILGELGAIMAFPLLAYGYNKLQGSKAGGKFLPQLHTGRSAPSTAPGMKGKLINGAKWATETNKGRLGLAALLGGGLVAGQHAIFGSGGETLEGEATSAFRNTLLMELALGALLPAAVIKGKGMLANRQAAKLAAARGGFPQYAPVNGRMPSPMMPGSVGPNAMARAPMMNIPAVAGGAAPGLMGRAAGLGKGVFRNAGILGTGFAAYDGLTTEGDWWDKSKAFGTSLLTTAAIGKGLSIGGQMFSSAGRAGLMSGLKGAGSWLGRMAVGQGLRTAAVGAAGLLGSPVVLVGGGLALLGAGAYFGYQKFFGTDKAAIMRYRMAQYGISNSSEAEVKVIAQLENLLKKYVIINGTTGDFRKNLPYKDIVGLFGVSGENQEHFDRFSIWFTHRFKPVYLRGISAYRNAVGGNALDVEKADELPKEKKLQILSEINGLDSRIYDIPVLPFTSSKPTKYNAAKVKDEYNRSYEKIEHEKDTTTTSSDGTPRSSVGSGNFAKDWPTISAQVARSGSSSLLAMNTITSAAITAANTAAGVPSSTQTSAMALMKLGYGTKNPEIGQQLNNMRFTFDQGMAQVTNPGNLAAMSGSQKQWQLAVYQAFKKAQFSEQQSRILTAEIGRENAYNPKYLFGGHADPHRGTNLGMLSWQGERKPKLIAFLKQRGVIDGAGNIARNQTGLDAQAEFIMWELRNTHKKAGNAFLANPNIGYNEGARILGTQYILWRYTDSRYASGHRNRDGYYNMLLKQLGGKEPASLPISAKGGGDGVSSLSTTTNALMNAAAMAASVGRNPAKPQGSISGMLNTMNPGGARFSPTGVGNNPVAAANTIANTAILIAGTAMGVNKNHRAYRAAEIATKRTGGSRKSKQWCAREVATALLQAGYKFTRQNSAYQYATNGTLKGAGFTQIQDRNQYQIGDVMVWPAHGIVGGGGGAKHGHIQIFNGRVWVSDFIQGPNKLAGRFYTRVTPSLWRDSTLIGRAVTGAVPSATAGPQVNTNVGADSDRADPMSPAAKESKAIATSMGMAGGSGSIIRRDPGSTAAKTAPMVASTNTGNYTTVGGSITRPSTTATAGTTASTATTSAALEASNSTRSQQQASQNDEFVDLQKQQLGVQREMLKTLGDIRKLLTKDPKPETKPAAAGAKPGGSSKMPVSMDLNLN